MSKAKTTRTRRKRRWHNARGPNRGAKHRGKSGRTGSMHHKKTPSKKPQHYIVTISISMRSADLHSICKDSKP